MCYWRVLMSDFYFTVHHKNLQMEHFVNALVIARSVSVIIEIMKLNAITANTLKINIIMEPRGMDFRKYSLPENWLSA